jgi:hypothetical protein
VSLSAIPKALRAAVAERDGGRCCYCHLRQVGQAAVFHVDHVVPRSRGGPTEEDNLASQCPACSLRKASKTAAVDPASGEVVALFHPLRQRWEEHFRVDPDGTCIGLSPTGRATVEALRMNDPLPRTARALQIAAGVG